MSSVFVVGDCAFKTISVSESGEEQVLGFHLAGDLIGLDALGTGMHRCEGIGLTPADVCEISFEEIMSIATRLQNLHRQLMKVMGQCVDRDNHHMEILYAAKPVNELRCFCTILVIAIAGLDCRQSLSKCR